MISASSQQTMTGAAPIRESLDPEEAGLAQYFVATDKAAAYDLATWAGLGGNERNGIAADLVGRL